MIDGAAIKWGIFRIVHDGPPGDSGGMEETGTAPVGEQPEDAEAHATEETLRDAQEQASPGSSQPETAPDDPDNGEWVPA